MTKLFLIRHGETDYNLKKMYCGHSNPPLNATGIAQAKALVSKIKHIKFDKVYSSDLLRACQSAEIIFENYTIEQEKGLREINFGVFEGMKNDEIMKKHRDIYTKWIDSPSKVDIPLGENLKDFAERINKTISKIANANKNKSVAIVTHSGPIRILLCSKLNRKLDEFWEIETKNGTVHIFDYE